MLPGLLADLRAAMPDSAADLVDAMGQQSYALTKRGDAQGAIKALEDALAIAREHCGPLHRITLATAGLLGNTLSTFGRDREALAVLEPAVADAQEAHGATRPHSELARLESLLAGAMISSGRLRQAEALLRQVLRDQWLLDGRDTTRNRYTRNMLAVVLAARGDLSGGIEQMREALAADKRLCEKATVDTGTMTSQLGGMLVEAGQGDEGFVELDRGEALVRAAGGSGQRHPAQRRQVRRAHCLLLSGHPSAALDAARSVLDEAADCSGSNLAVAARVRVGALRALGRLAEADAHVAEMEALAKRHASPENRARAHMEIAELRHAQGRAAEGLPFARRALEGLTPTQVSASALLQSARKLVVACENDAGRGCARASVSIEAESKM
jgi:tetratricopeptide (TPR) repeat protein